MFPQKSDEAEKWEKITYVGIATCTILTIYNLSKGHHHYPEPPVFFFAIFYLILSNWLVDDF